MRYAKIYITLIVSLISLYGCNQQSMSKQEISNKSTEELIQLLEDQNDPENLFGAITAELAKRGASASEAAPALSVALTYPRRDSYLAGFALMAIGPDAKSAIPSLISELSSERSSVRRYAALSLGTIGEASKCAVPRLASLLWHPDSETRSAVSISLDAIIRINFVDPEDKLDPKNPGVLPKDEPEGIVSGLAREWWINTGQNMNWPTENCEPPK